MSFNGGDVLPKEKNMDVNADIIAQALIGIKNVEEKFARIQENPALYGSENGLTNQEHETLEKLIALIGEANLAANAILNRA
jgi:hypothetical protein